MACPRQAQTACIVGTQGQRAEETYLPWPPEFPPTDADPMGDGVAETLMLRDFASAIRRQTAPGQDVYFGVELSITGIQAMRSSLAGSLPVEIPDLRHLDVRRAHAADDCSPSYQSSSEQPVPGRPTK